jgi:mitogen-activated protein kinase 1/3
MHRPLFPGKDYVDQLKLIVKTLGPPPEEDLTFISSHKARAYIRALPPVEVGVACL